MIRTWLALTMLGPLAATAALAQQNLPPVQSGPDVAAPVEIVADKRGGSVECQPPQARLPASDELDLRLVNRSDDMVTIVSPRFLDEEHVLRFEGAVAHAASNQGYVVKPGGVGRLIVRTPPPGDYAYQCIPNRNQGSPFKGTLTIVPKAG